MSFQAQGTAAVAHLPQGARGYLVLVAIAQGGAPTQLDLVQRLGIDKTSMTRLIDALENEDLVIRRADRSDRRARRVEITSTGTEALGRARVQLEQIEADLLSPLSATEADAFRAMLARVAGHADSTERCAD